MKETKLSKLIKQYRKDNSLTQKQFAQLVDCSQDDVSRWESGRDPSYRHSLKIFEILNQTDKSKIKAITG